VCSYRNDSVLEKMTPRTVPDQARINTRSSPGQCSHLGHIPAASPACARKGWRGGVVEAPPRLDVLACRISPVMNKGA
jgi:hypothetical protein